MAESNEVLGVHVCIATEQVLANALPLRLLPWQRVIVVASDHLRGKQRGKLMQFLRWAEEEVLRRGGVPQAGIRVVELRDQGMHWGDLLGFARRLAAELMLELAPGQRLDVNVTGGTKLMTQAFATAFAGQARLVYCNTQGQALEVLDAFGEVPPLPLPPDLLSLPEYLRAQGHELLGCQGGGDAVWWRGVAARRALTVALVQEGTRLRMTPGLKGRQRLLNGLHGVAAGCLPQPARGPQQPARGFVQEGVLEGAPRSAVWCELVAQLAAHGVAQVVEWDEWGRLVLRWADEAAARYVAGAYLEEYAALCMEALGVPLGQWGVNVRLRPQGSQLQAGVDYQELDLAVVWGNRMWVVECKAGQQLHRSSGTGQEVLNRLEALKAHVGGSLGEAWLLAPLTLHPEWQRGVLERARQYGVKVVHGRQGMAGLPAMLASALGLKVVEGGLGVGLVGLSRALDLAQRG